MSANLFVRVHFDIYIQCYMKATADCQHTSHLVHKGNPTYKRLPLFHNICKMTNTRLSKLTKVKCTFQADRIVGRAKQVISSYIRLQNIVRMCMYMCMFVYVFICGVKYLSSKRLVKCFVPWFLDAKSRRDLLKGNIAYSSNLPRNYLKLVNSSAFHPFTKNIAIIFIINMFILLVVVMTHHATATL